MRAEPRCVALARPRLSSPGAASSRFCGSPSARSPRFRSARAAGAARRSGILSASPPDRGPDLATWREELLERGVVCTTPDGYLRFAPHWPNAVDEVEVIRDALTRI